MGGTGRRIPSIGRSVQMLPGSEMEDEIVVRASQTRRERPAVDTETGLGTVAVALATGHGRGVVASPTDRERGVTALQTDHGNEVVASPTDQEKGVVATQTRQDQHAPALSHDPIETTVML